MMSEDCRVPPHAPIEIHRYRTRDALVELFAAARRDYSSSSTVKRLWEGLFRGVGLASSEVARDRLVLRFQPPRESVGAVPFNRSISTLGFHRDTWATNLYSQINWWAPVYPITSGRTFAMFPHLWSIPVGNNSGGFDMAEAMHRVRVAGVPNHTGLTRISLETRTLSIEDYLARRGAPNVDGRARLTSPGMFRRLNDGMSLPDIVGSRPLEPFEGPRPAAVA